MPSPAALRPTCSGSAIDRIEVRARGYRDARGFLNVAPVPVGFKRVLKTARSGEGEEGPASVERWLAPLLFS